jgi:hypothetical protein
MLEGQVAALSSAGLSAGEQADLLDALFESALVRPDLDTFMLAPPRRPPGFLDKNVIDPDAVGSKRVAVATGRRRRAHRGPNGRRRDVPVRTGSHHGCRSAARLERLAETEQWARSWSRELDDVLGIYESVFHHRAYIGRSGSMYAYEGIGSIYWHMVTKLLLAVQEAAADARRRGDDAGAVERLRDAYWRVRGGLGVNKSAEEFGAIPIDPYSHTPAHAGAQQPGMTGAVKEEILARRRELGVAVDSGRIEFDVVLVRPEELLEAPADWPVDGVAGGDGSIEVPAGAVGSDGVPGADRGRGRCRRRLTHRGPVLRRPNITDSARSSVGASDSSDSAEIFGRTRRRPSGAGHDRPVDEPNSTHRPSTQAHESDGHDVDQGVQRSEVVGIPRVERQLERASDCSDHQVDRSCASRLATRCSDCRIDAPVGPSRISVERQRGEGCLGPLQTILPSCSLRWILGSVGASCEFGHRDRRHGDLGREHTHIDAVEVDHDGRVEHARAGQPRGSML